MKQFFVGDNAFVVIGSALNALGNSDFKCIEELIKVLDEIPEPIREQVETFLIYNLGFLFYSRRLFYCLFHRAFKSPDVAQLLLVRWNREFYRKEQSCN